MWGRQWGVGMGESGHTLGGWAGGNWSPERSTEHNNGVGTGAFRGDSRKCKSDFCPFASLTVCPTGCRSKVCGQAGTWGWSLVEAGCLGMHLPAG